MWILRCYDPSDGAGGIHAWYLGLTGDVQALVDSALEMLETETGPLIDLPHYEEMRKNCAGLDKVIIEHEDGRHFRILAFRGPGKRECTLLHGFEKISAADYGKACLKANERKDGVIKDGRRAPKCRFPPD